MFNFFAGFGTIKFLGGKWLFAAISTMAVVDSVNPCAISVLLLTIAFLFSLDKERKEIIKIGGLYVFAIFLTYFLIGIGLLKAMSLFGVPRFMTRFGAVIIIIFGAISLIERYFPNFPIKTKIPESAKPAIARIMAKGTALAMLAVGFLVALVEFPCTGGPYVLTLSLLHDNIAFAKVFAYLFFYNIIFVLPLIIILLIASHKTLLAKVKDWKKKSGGEFDFWSAIAMIALGIVIFLL